LCSMKTRWMQWLILPSFFLCSCCPVNRLKGRSRPVKTVTYEAVLLEKPTVRLTGHRPLKVQPGVPSNVWAEPEAELERALAGIASDDFSALLLQRAAERLGARTGWESVKNGGDADAVMQIRVENICFCAQDVQAEVEVKLALKILLLETNSGELLFRDCLDWTFEGVYASLSDLAQADTAQRGEVFSDLAERVLERLAKHLATKVPKG
jgi:hypothetical protein